MRVYNSAYNMSMVKKINSHARNFTLANWETFGAVGHEESWQALSPYDNSHINVGDTAYIEGTVQENNKTAKIYGTVKSVVNGSNGAVVMVSTHLEVEGRTFGAYTDPSRRVIYQQSIQGSAQYTYTASEHVILYFGVWIQANSSAGVDIQINDMSVVSFTSNEAMSSQYSVLPIILCKGDTVKYKCSSNRASTVTIFALK